MTDIAPTKTPEHLSHYEYETQPFTPQELAGIARYEEAIIGIPDTVDWSGWVLDMESTGEFLSLFAVIGDWFTALDVLQSDLESEVHRSTGGQVYNDAAYRYLRIECAAWYRALHRLRRAVCKHALGTAGPQPSVDGGHLVLSGGHVLLDGTIAAEDFG